MVSTKVKDWDGFPVREVQLSDDVDVQDETALSEVLSKYIAEEELIGQGQAKRLLKKKTTSTNSIGGELRVSSGHSTDYDSWSRFSEQGDEEELVEEVTAIDHEDQEKNDIRQKASSNAFDLREKGNEAIKQGHHVTAVRNYTSAIRHLPSAVLFSNRAQAFLKLGELDKAKRDCSTAIAFDSKYTKAYIRRANILKLEGRYDEALQDMRHAKTLEPRNGEIKKLTRWLETHKLEHEYEQDLVTAAATGSDEKAGELRDIQDIVNRLRKAHTDSEEAKNIKPLFSKLKRLVKNSEENRDFFSLCEGVPAALDVYTEDNQQVLSLVAEACKDNERNLATLKKNPALVDFLVRTIRDRRVAIIALALEILCGLIPLAKTVITRLRHPPYLETLVLMMAKGPGSLHERVVSLLLLVSQSPRACYDLRAFAPTLADGLGRALGVANLDTKREALEGAVVLCRTDDKLCRLLAVSSMGDACLDLLKHQSDGAPVVRQVELSGGAEITYRDLTKLRDEPLQLIATALDLLCHLSRDPKFVADLDAKDAWLVLVPYVAPPDDTALPAMRLWRRCCETVKSASSALVQLGGSEALLELLSRCVSEGELEEATLAVLRHCGDLPTFQEVLKAHVGLDVLIPRLKTTLSDAVLSDLCQLLVFTAAYDSMALKAMSTTHKGLGKELVQLWYARGGSTREHVETLVSKIMGTEEGALAISEGLEEAQVLKFVSDLRAKRQIQAARETGGANLLNPEKYNPSGQPLSEDEVLQRGERHAELARVDVGRLHTYLTTLLPRHDAVVVDLLAGAGQARLFLHSGD
eukprot:gene19132-22876_t